MFGFAVDNGAAISNSTSRDGWLATTLDEASWNAGFDVSKSGNPAILTSAFGDYDTFFSEASANVYWNSTGLSLGELVMNAPQGDILQMDMDDRFFYTSGAPASNLSAFFLACNSSLTLIINTPYTASVNVGTLRHKTGFFIFFRRACNTQVLSTFNALTLP